MAIKETIKRALRPLVRTAWPLAETAARHIADKQGLTIRWRAAWDSEFDQALDALPPLEGCTRALYRELVRPTGVPKRHALACENGAPVALVSLRRRRHFWEPVTYQCLPKALAPALNPEVLGRTLKALGVEINVQAGLGPEAEFMGARYCWSYPYYVIDLQGDYEAHWRLKKRQYTIRRARKNLEGMEVRIDGEGDLQWAIEQWRAQWANDADQEVVAAPDRQNFWSAVQRANDPNTVQLHCLQLLSQGRRVAGVVFTSAGDTVMMQCGGRDPEFDDAYSAAGVTLASIDWAKAHGFRTLDLAGGGQKRLWGPQGGVRYGVVFRSRLIDRLGWAFPDLEAPEQ